MTTIAFDGRTLAGDRRSSLPGVCVEVQKIRRCADGWLIGAAGGTSACQALLDWLEEGGEGEPPVPLDSDEWTDLIAISPEGEAFAYGTYGRFRVLDPFFAIGSGSAYAVAAMALGRDAIDAVQLAARFDPGTGCTVDSFDLALSALVARQAEAA